MRESRKHWRITEQNSVVITVEPSGNESDKTASQLICSTADVSEIGMRLACRQELPKGAHLKVMVAIKDPPSSFSLNGKVRWAGPDDEEGRYVAGIKLIDNDDAMIKKWKDLIRSKLPKNVESEMKGSFAPDEGSAW